jgi:hypothetical protein
VPARGFLIGANSASTSSFACDPCSAAAQTEDTQSKLARANGIDFSFIFGFIFPHLLFLLMKNSCLLPLHGMYL